MSVKNLIEQAAAQADNLTAQANEMRSLASRIMVVHAIAGQELQRQAREMDGTAYTLREAARIALERMAA